MKRDACSPIPSPFFYDTLFLKYTPTSQHWLFTSVDCFTPVSVWLALISFRALIKYQLSKSSPTTLFKNLKLLSLPVLPVLLLPGMSFSKVCNTIKHTMCFTFIYSLALFPQNQNQNVSSIEMGILVLLIHCCIAHIYNYD